MTVISQTAWPSLPPIYPTVDSSSGFGVDNQNGDTANLSIINPTTKPFADNTALRFTFFQGMGGGGAPNTLTNDFGFRGNVVGLESGCDEMYLDWWFRFGPPSGVGNDLTGPWDNNLNAGTKFGFVYGTIEGALEAHIFINSSPQFGIQQESNSAGVGVANPSAYGFANALEWFSGGNIDDGSWQRHTIHIKSNTGTSFNGLCSYWRNGILMYAITDAKFFQDGVTKRFAQFQITPTYGGGTRPVPTDQFMDVGPWYVSGKVNGF